MSTRSDSDSGKFDVMSISVILKAELDLPVGIGYKSARVDRVQWGAAALTVVAAMIWVRTGWFEKIENDLGLIQLFILRIIFIVDNESKVNSIIFCEY